jgi:AcrR family transcriptional regulator
MSTEFLLPISSDLQSVVKASSYMTMATAPNLGDSKGSSSRERILHAAKQLFSSRGYENTSTVAIARLAGTSESQLMKHFGSKEGLLEAIFDDGWTTLASAVKQIEGIASPVKKLNMLVEIMLAAMERDPELKLLILLEGRRIRKEGQMVLITQGFLQFVHVIDSVLAEMRAAHQLRPDINADALRSALMGMFEGLMRDQLLAKKMGFPSTFTAADMSKIFNTLLPALASPK